MSATLRAVVAAFRRALAPPVAVVFHPPVMGSRASGPEADERIARFNARVHTRHASR